MRRRKGLVWLYLLAMASVLAAGVWYYLERQARKRAQRQANDTIDSANRPVRERRRMARKVAKTKATVKAATSRYSSMPARGDGTIVSGS